jgi:hypothetical protein
MEPHVSVPMPNATSAAETAAPVPEEDPPVHRFVFHGFRPGPDSDESQYR